MLPRLAHHRARQRNRLSPGLHSPLVATGNKAKDKIYYSHSGYPGGLKDTTFEKLIAKKPEMVLEKAVKGMLPKGPLGRAMFRKLKVYAGTEHNHAAQQPQVLDI